jgi:glycosyltransferase involved in cell wall biosynthesis
VHVRDLAGSLVEQGENVTVLAGGDGILFEQLARSGVPCRALKRLIHPIRPLQDLTAYLEIKQVLRELQPDLLTTHSNKAGLLGRLAARSLNIPVVHTSHGFLFSDRPNSSAGHFYRLMEKLASGWSDRIIAVCESEFKVAERFKVIPPKKMVVIHNGLPDLQPPMLARPDIDPPHLIMVARFAAPKDHLSLFKALGLLIDLPWSLTLVGDGDGRREAEELAVRLGISERIEFLGVREDVPALLVASQLFVLSTQREGFPLSVLEAMRAGLPVVASNVGGISEAVKNGTTGLLFPAGNVEVLQEHLALLINNRNLRLNMGQAGRRRFSDKFTLQQMVEKTTAIYHSITG